MTELGRFVDRVIERVGAPPIDRRDDVRSVPTSTVAWGSAGVAYALARLATIRDDRELRDRALAWLLHAKTATAAEAIAGDVDAALANGPSLHFGTFGIAVIDALLTDAPLAWSVTAVPGDLLCGAAGWLAAVPNLLARTDHVRGEVLAKAIALDVPSRGIAHGRDGLAWAAMRWSTTAIPKLEECEGRGTPRWCDGAAGRVHVWIELHHRTRDERYLERAFVDAEIAYADELATPLASLCCGLAGRAYALSALHDYTDVPACRDRARELADLAIAREPQSLGLYKGALGVAVLAAELDAGMSPRMPLFAEDA